MSGAEKPPESVTGCPWPACACEDACAELLAETPAQLLERLGPAVASLVAGFGPLVDLLAGDELSAGVRRPCEACGGDGWGEGVRNRRAHECPVCDGSGWAS